MQGTSLFPWRIASGGQWHLFTKLPRVVWITRPSWPNHRRDIWLSLSIRSSTAMRQCQRRTFSWDLPTRRRNVNGIRDCTTEWGKLASLSTRNATKNPRRRCSDRYFRQDGDISMVSGLDEGSSKPFWNYIRSQKQNHMGVSPLKKNGQLHPDSTTKCDILADKFKSVFTKDVNDTHRTTKLYGQSYPLIPDLNFQEEGVQKLLACVYPSKTVGPDKIPCRLLNEHSDELALVSTRPTTDHFRWPV